MRAYLYGLVIGAALGAYACSLTIELKKTQSPTLPTPGGTTLTIVLPLQPPDPNDEPLTPGDPPYLPTAHWLMEGVKVL